METPRVDPGSAVTRALLVEDNAMNQVVAQKMLVRLNCRVDIAVNGREAVDMSARMSYDVVFMDCQMPVMDGYEATAQIRRREAPGTRLPVIGVTARALAGDRERCLAAGMDDYITKPVTLDGFRTMLKKWTRAPEGAPEGPAPAATPEVSAPAGTPSGSDRTALDERRLGQLTALTGGDALLRRLVGRFLDTTPADLGKIRAASDARDAQALRNAAHGLRGACLNLGVQEAARLLTSIEELASKGQVDEAVSAAADVPGELARARMALEAFLKRL